MKAFSRLTPTARALLVAGLILEAADLVLTAIAVAHGARELNPLLRPVVHHFGWFLLVKAGLCALLWHGATRKVNAKGTRVVTLALAAHAVIFTLIALSNCFGLARLVR